jgi:DNA-binding transcriptional LysR family regulator
VLDLTRLRVLAAVARHGSVTAAARALRYAQPSVSHHLARLEAETGARLVQKVGRGIRLTEAGRLLAERAEEVLGRLDQAEAELAEHTGLRAGRVRLAAFPSALGTFVPRAAAAFAAAHPDVALEFVEAEPPDAVGRLRAGEVDVAVIFSYADEPASGLRRTRLAVDPLHLVTRRAVPAGPASRPRRPRLTDHARTNWIAGCERCRAELLHQCERAGFDPRIIVTSDDYVAVQALVAAGLGVTILPGLALAAHRNSDVDARSIPGAARTVSAALFGEPPDPPATAALVRHLVTAAR